MAFTPGETDGPLNGTTPVTLVAAPAAATQRLVRKICIQQRDTASVTLTLRKVTAGGTRQLWKGTLDPGDTFFWYDEVLAATTSSITAVLAGAPATINPDFTSNWADKT